MKRIKLLLNFLFCGVAMSGLNAQCPTGQVDLELSSLSNNPAQVGTIMFFDDFGTSDFNNGNIGRKTTPYMPANGFEFGNSYLQLGPGGNPWDNNPIRNAARINDGFYAVVAPGYINEGWFEDDSWDSWWTPSYNESSPVYDYSGTVDGAALVVNAGELLTPFYERRGLVQIGTTYRASFKFFVVKKQATVGIDILDATTRQVLFTMETQTYNTDYEVDNVDEWRDVELDFTMPGDNPCDVREIIVSFRNHHQLIDGNDWYVDNIQLQKIEDGPNCIPIENCLRNGVTSVDLNSAFIGTPPTGSTLVWFDNENHLGQPISNPEAVTQSGNYYAFFYNPNENCYNTSVSQSSVEVLILNQCCIEFPASGTPEITQVGISTLNRNVDNWLSDENQNQLGAYIALESTNKAMVITRNANPETNIATPVEGMVVWDTTDNCLKLYKGSEIGWSCTSNQCNQ